MVAAEESGSLKATIPAWRLDMMLVGLIGPKLLSPVCIILSQKDVIITDFFQSRVRGYEYDEIFTSPRRGSFLEFHRDILDFAVLASFQVTIRPGITMIFFCDALSQVVLAIVSPDFSAAITGTVTGESQEWKDSMDFVPLRSVVDQRLPLCASDPFLSPSISVSASVALSASMFRRIKDLIICLGFSITRRAARAI